VTGPAQTDRLRRAYRRLLLAYPRWHRRERGAELLTTLLDDAAPGRRRPTFAEAADLIRAGLRARVTPPRGFGRVLALVVAVYAALAGAAVAALLTGYPGPPSEAQALTAATAAVPVQPRNVPGPAVECDLICPGWDRTDDVVAVQAPPDRTDRTIVYLDVPRQDAPAVAARARDRLVASGWRVGPMRVQSDGLQQFDASKAGLNLNLLTGVDAPITILVTKRFSTTATVVILAGFGGGLLAGWLTTVWALQRFRRHAPLRRVGIAAAIVPFLVLAPLMSCLAVALAVFAGLEPDRSYLVLKAPLAVFPGFWWPVTAVAAGSAAVALILAGLPSGTPSTRRQPHLA
jgi:hypothetical protein